MTYAERMRVKLTEAYKPTALEIVDDSESHRGHGGFIEGGETHFNIAISSPAFKGMSRVAQQRSIMTLLKAELDERVHALALKVSTD